MGFLLKLKNCFCSRTVPVKGLKEDPKASCTKMVLEDDDVVIARRKVLLDDALGEEGSVGSVGSVGSTNQRGLEEESVAMSDSYQSMLSMLLFLSMGGGQHVSIEEVIQKSGEARSDSYQSMLSMLHFLSMGGGQHVSIEEVIQKSGEARSDSYQSMLSMLHFLSMGGGQHVSIKEVIQKSGEEEIQEEGNDDMRDAFNFFDTDGNGSISANDLHTTLSNLGENASMEECRLMVQAVSRTNDNSSVAFADFQRLLVEA